MRKLLIKGIYDVGSLVVCISHNVTDIFTLKFRLWWNLKRPVLDKKNNCVCEHVVDTKYRYIQMLVCPKHIKDYDTSLEIYLYKWMQM